MIALIDGDLIAYPCAATCKNGEELWVAESRAEELLLRILGETGVQSYRLFLTSGDNFRKGIYPLYKANRIDVERPVHLESVREYLVVHHNAEVTSGIEADDMLGILAGNDTIVCSYDKDLLQIPGRHYDWRTQTFKDVSEIEGRRWFWYQMVMGDRADNVPGYDGKMRNKPPKFLQPTIDALMSMDDEDEMYRHVLDMYTDEDQFHINRKLFHILREPLAEDIE